MEQTLVVDGKLGNHALAEVIYDTCASGLSGALRLSNERMKAVLYFNAGALVLAASNLRQTRLIECLFRWQFVTPAQLGRVDPAISDADLTKHLVENRILTEDRLQQLINRQVSESLSIVSQWTEGDWSFDVRVRLSQPYTAKVALGPILAQAARGIAKEIIAARCSLHGAQLSRIEPQPDDVVLLPKEAFLLSRIDMTMTVDELRSISGLPEDETLHSLYALILSGCVAGKIWPSVYGTEQLDRLKQLATASKRVGAGPASAPGKQPGGKKESARPAGLSESAPEKVVLTDDQQRLDLDQFLRRMREVKTFYEVLQVERSVSDAGIKRSYYQLAKLYHPDRFHREKGTKKHEQLQAAFALIAQAYDTLREAKLRTSYDLKLDKQGEAKPLLSGFGVTPQATVGTPLEQAEERFQMGLQALKQKNGAQAYGMFAQAVKLAPRDPRYRAQYGQMLASNEQTMRKAEAEFQEAIKLDPQNAEYRYLLALLYREVGFLKRAQSEAQRTLAMNPQHAGARRLIAELQK